jgi:hypothetical protein
MNPPPRYCGVTEVVCAYVASARRRFSRRWTPDRAGWRGGGPPEPGLGDPGASLGFASRPGGGGIGTWGRPGRASTAACPTRRMPSASSRSGRGGSRPRPGSARRSAWRWRGPPGPRADRRRVPGVADRLPRLVVARVPAVLAPAVQAGQGQHVVPVPLPEVIQHQAQGVCPDPRDAQVPRLGARGSLRSLVDNRFRCGVAGRAHLSTLAAPGPR